MPKWLLHWLVKDSIKKRCATEGLASAVPASFSLLYWLLWDSIRKRVPGLLCWGCSAVA